MPLQPANPDRQVPLRALILSVAALLVPVAGALVVPDSLGEFGAILWLTALVPAFLLAYYRGWRGAATALAVGMATLSVTQVVANWIGRDIPDLLLGIVVAYLFIVLGIGAVAEALHRERDTVEDLAFTDILTHLPNRRHARMFLENEFAAGERGRLLSVVLFDLDYFKQYNDRYGHGAGDSALQAFAAILTQSTRKMNLSARFGGEEFVTILAGSDAEGSMIFAERVRAALQGANLNHGALTVSAGVATHHPTMRGPDELLAAADHALYRAKREGRNCVRVFGRPLLEQTVTDDGPTVVLPDAGPPEGSEQGPQEPEHHDYPRSPEDIGRSRPPVTLLPHQITGFGTDRRALLVEDEDGVRGLIQTYLNREGFIVDEARDFPSASKLLENEYDIVITDVRLPGPSGTQLVRAVAGRWPLTPVIVMTGLRDPAVAAEAMAAGADHYLFKPFGMPELRSHVVDLLARRARLLEEAGSHRDVIRPESAAGSILGGALDALVRSAEARERLANGRGARQAAIGSALLAHLPDGIAEDPIDPELFRQACMVLSVGRIGIPEELLNRAAPLDAKELALVRTSAERGARLLEAAGQHRLILEAVRWQGERFDGTGVPHGLAGGAIPLVARLACIVRALEAMTRDRPYANRFEWGVAVEVMGTLTGSHFDPDLMEAFELALPELRAVCEPSPGSDRV